MSGRVLANFSCVDLALSGDEMLRQLEYEGCKEFVSFLRRDAPVLVLASPKLLPSFFLQEYLSSGVNNKLDVEMHATGFITSFVSILSNTI